MIDSLCSLQDEYWEQKCEMTICLELSDMAIKSNYVFDIQYLS